MSEVLRPDTVEPSGEAKLNKKHDREALVKGQYVWEDDIPKHYAEQINQVCSTIHLLPDNIQNAIEFAQSESDLSMHEVLRLISLEYRFKHHQLDYRAYAVIRKNISETDSYDSLRHEIGFSATDITDDLDETLKRYKEAISCDSLQQVHHDLLRIDLRQQLGNIGGYIDNHEAVNRGLVSFLELENPDGETADEELIESFCTQLLQRSPHKYSKGRMASFLPTPALIAQIWVANTHNSMIQKTSSGTKESEPSFLLDFVTLTNKKAREVLLAHDLLEINFGENVPEHSEVAYRRLDRNNPSGHPVMQEYYPRMEHHGDQYGL